MTAETIFSVCNMAVLPAWLLLVVAPRWKVTVWLVHSAFIPLVFGAIYAVLAWVYILNAEAGGFGSLDDVAALFANPYALLAGWIHYLAFDLFVGAWEVRDAQRNRIPHLAVVPCLPLTFMAGPAGLLLYLIIRFAVRRNLLLTEEPIDASAAA